MLRTIKLYGTLAIDSGIDSFKMDVDNSALLFRGLKNLIPNFFKIVANYKELFVLATKDNGDKKEVQKTGDLMMNFGDCETIHVMPSTEGDISEAMLVEALVAAVIAAAASYVITRLSIQNAPKPTTAKSDTSFIFGGPQNTANQGGAVPIIYGTCLTGSTLIATNFQVLDVPIGTIANTSFPGGGLTINPQF